MNTQLSADIFGKRVKTTGFVTVGFGAMLIKGLGHAILCYIAGLKIKQGLVLKYFGSNIFQQKRGFRRPSQDCKESVFPFGGNLLAKYARK